MTIKKSLSLLLFTTATCFGMEKQPSDEQTNPFDKNPIEVNLEILSHLTIRELHQIPAVSKSIEEARMAIIYRGKEITFNTSEEIDAFLSNDNPSKPRRFCLGFIPNEQQLAALIEECRIVTIPGDLVNDVTTRIYENGLQIGFSFGGKNSKYEIAMSLLRNPKVYIEFADKRGLAYYWKLSDIKTLLQYAESESEETKQLIRTKIIKSLAKYEHTVTFAQYARPGSGSLSELKATPEYLGLLSNYRVTGVRPYNISTLADFISENKSITSLNLEKHDRYFKSTNEIGFKETEFLANALIENSSLTSIDLKNNEIGIKGIHDLLVKFREANKALTFLGLEDNGTWGNDAPFKKLTLFALADMLNNNPTPIFLNLNTNSIGVDGAEALAFALNRSDKRAPLTHLSLNFTQIGDEGIMHLSGALVNMRTLTSLSLRSNEISNEGVKSVANLLDNNNSLTSLDLGSNDIQDEGIEVLIKALENNFFLTNLSLENNYLSDAALESLKQIMSRKPDLKIIF